MTPHVRRGMKPSFKQPPSSLTQGRMPRVERPGSYRKHRMVFSLSSHILTLPYTRDASNRKARKIFGHRNDEFPNGNIPRRYKRGCSITVRLESITTIPKGLRLKEPPSSTKQELDRKVRLLCLIIRNETSPENSFC
jgi:hypothetical protein